MEVYNYKDRVVDFEKRPWMAEKGHVRQEGLLRVIEEGIELAHSNAPVPLAGGQLQVEDEDVGYLSDGWDNGMESYEPHLGVMIKGDLHLDNLPRESPPFVVKESKRRRKKTPEWTMWDWDTVSVATEESFCIV
jgi:hypothetical protein